MHSPLKRSTTIVLQAAIVLVGTAALAFLLGEPHVEGRNAHATVFEIYCKDPFLAYVYVGSLPFFVALHRAYRLLGRVRQTGAFSAETVESLRTIRRCAFTLLGFVAGGVVIIFFAGDKDDRPAGFFMALLVALSSGAIATAATLLARKLSQTLKQTAGDQEG